MCRIKNIVDGNKKLRRLAQITFSSTNLHSYIGGMRVNAALAAASVRFELGAFRIEWRSFTLRTHPLTQLTVAF